MQNKKPKRRQSKRSNARLATVQCLYSWDIGGQRDPIVTFEDYLRFHQSEQVDFKFDLAYTKELYFGTCNQVDELDELINQFSDRSVDKLDNIERAILRYSTWELLNKLDTDAPIIINEAVEVAKEIGSSGSYTLVNSFLDRLKRQVRDDLKIRHAAKAQGLTIR